MSHQVLIKELENRIKNKAESLQKQLREAAKEAEIYVDSKESATNNSFSKTLLTELSNDIDLILTKAREGLKGRNGSPAVRHFLREVKDKVKKMIAGIKEVEVKTIAESIVNKIEEAEKTGSFSDIESQVRAAIKSNPLFPEKIGERYADGPYVRDMYPDRVVISYEGKLFEMEYSIMKEAVILGTPKEVIEKYVPVTEASKDKVEVKETARIEVLRESQTQDFEVSGFVSLKEAKFNSDFSEVEVVLIEAGCNEQKKRYYPDKTIKEAASIFTGWKMYINNLTATEEKERPERNLKDWASTIVESRYDNGMAIGKVAIHDSWLRERLADPVARQHIGLSINTGGKISVGRVNGKDGYQIVEAIIPARKNGPPSVDWVTEAGARGRVNKLLESRRGGVKMELEMATMKDLKETRSDLVEAVTKEIQAGNSEKVTKLEKDLKEAQDKIASFDKTDKINKQVELVESILKDKKIPAVSKERIIGQVKAAVIDGDIKESITKLIEAELEYVNKLSPKGKIKLSESKDTDIKESLQNQLDKRAGVEEKKEEKE